jgi:hypothetical protein
MRRRHLADEHPDTEGCGGLRLALTERGHGRLAVTDLLVVAERFGPDADGQPDQGLPDL